MEKLKDEEDDHHDEHNDSSLDCSACIGGDVPGDRPSTIPEEPPHRMTGASMYSAAPETADPDLQAKKRLLEFEDKAMRKLKEIVEALEAAEKRLESLRDIPGQEGEPCLKELSNI